MMESKLSPVLSAPNQKTENRLDPLRSYSPGDTGVGLHLQMYLKAWEKEDRERKWVPEAMPTCRRPSLRLHELTERHKLKGRGSRSGKERVERLEGTGLSQHLGIDRAPAPSSEVTRQ